MNDKNLPIGYRILKLKDCIVQLNTGLNPRDNFKLGCGRIKYITAKNLIGNGLIDFSNCSFVDEDAKKIINKRSKIKIGDVLFSCRAPIGQCHLITSDPNDFDIGESIFSIRANKEIVLPEYLSLYLSSNYFIKLATLNVTGSVIKEIQVGNLLNTNIIVPPIEVQNRIVSCINPIETKIINNNQINSELESMAKTIYDYWFLQFEFPNEEGKPYKSSGGKMVYSEQLKKEIPAGWEVVDLMHNDLCKSIKVGVDYFTNKNYLPTANVNGEEVTDGENISFEKRENRANMQPTKYSVWFAKMKNSIKHISIPNNSDWFINKYILSTGFQGLQCNEKTFAYMHSVINSCWFENYKDVISHGATQEGVNDDDLNNIVFVSPTNELLELYSKIVLPILEKKFSIIKENQELTSLRDFLLPLLMNGQVSVG